MQAWYDAAFFFSEASFQLVVGELIEAVHTDVAVHMLNGMLDVFALLNGVASLIQL